MNEQQSALHACAGPFHLLCLHNMHDTVKNELCQPLLLGNA